MSNIVIDNMYRRSLLETIIRMENGYRRNFNIIATLPWDSEYELVVLNIGHLLDALNLVINNEISFSQLSEWANFLEIREDILLEKNNEELIRDIVFELANPELSQNATDQMADALIGQIKNKKC